jgi:hypothetical protein
MHKPAKGLKALWSLGDRRRPHSALGLRVRPISPNEATGSAQARSMVGPAAVSPIMDKFLQTVGNIRIGNPRTGPYLPTSAGLVVLLPPIRRERAAERHVDYQNRKRGSGGSLTMIDNGADV